MTPTKFRIVTWNCCGGPFEKKFQYIAQLNPEPDIAIIQEIAQPKTPVQNCIWTASSAPAKGVAIIARNGFSVSPYPVDPEVPPVFVPAIIKGPVEFNLLAVWTQKKGNYVESFKAAFEHYRQFLLEKPSVITGDFNSNTIWDREYRMMNHSMVAKYCENELGLVSSYHKKMLAVQGREDDPTFFLTRKKNKPYHIDYCFAPDSWSIEKVEIGKYESWIDKSDHCPVIVDIMIQD